MNFTLSFLNLSSVICTTMIMMRQNKTKQKPRATKRNKQKQKAKVKRMTTRGWAGWSKKAHRQRLLQKHNAPHLLYVDMHGNHARTAGDTKAHSCCFQFWIVCASTYFMYTRYSSSLWSRAHSSDKTKTTTLFTGRVKLRGSDHVGPGTGCSRVGSTSRVRSSRDGKG